MISEKLDFEKLSNTRDLGGLVTKSGKKIVKGKLFRSGNLYKATKSDIEKLSKLVDLIIDLRTEKEISEKPDPTIASIKFLHFPVMKELTEGITREKEVTGSVVLKFADNPENARKYMCHIYKYFVQEDFPLSNYSKFVNTLLEKRDKAVLWHCTAGKDRAGFATTIVQEILGVDRKTIIEDYLYTNSCLREEINQIALTLVHKYVQPSSDINKSLIFQKAIDYLFGAKEEYITGLYDEINLRYGSFEGFIKNGLRIDDEKVKQLREMYLEEK